MGVDEFIHAVIDHVPDRQFKTVRHYSVDSWGIKRKFKRLWSLGRIAQMKLAEFIESWASICPNCGKKMEYVLSGRGKLPPKWKFGEGISDWNYISTGVS